MKPGSLFLSLLSVSLTTSALAQTTQAQSGANSTGTALQVQPPQMQADPAFRLMYPLIAVPQSSEVPAQVKLTVASVPERLEVSGVPAGMTVRLTADSVTVQTRNVEPGQYTLRISGLWGSTRRTAELLVSVYAVGASADPVPAIPSGSGETVVPVTPVVPIPQTPVAPAPPQAVKYGDVTVTPIPVDPAVTSGSSATGQAKNGATGSSPATSTTIPTTRTPTSPAPTTIPITAAPTTPTPVTQSPVAQSPVTPPPNSGSQLVQTPVAQVPVPPAPVPVVTMASPGAAPVPGSTTTGTTAAPQAAAPQASSGNAPLVMPGSISVSQANTYMPAPVPTASTPAVSTPPVSPVPVAQVAMPNPVPVPSASIPITPSVSGAYHAPAPAGNSSSVAPITVSVPNPVFASAPQPSSSLSSAVQMTTSSVTTGVNVPAPQASAPVSVPAVQPGQPITFQPTASPPALTNPSVVSPSSTTVPITPLPTASAPQVGSASATPSTQDAFRPSLPRQTDSGRNLTLWGGMGTERGVVGGLNMGLSAPLRPLSALNLAVRGTAELYPSASGGLGTPTLGADLLLSRTGSGLYFGPSASLAFGSGNSFAFGGLLGYSSRLNDTLGYYLEGRARYARLGGKNSLSPGFRMGVTYRFDHRF